MDRYWHHQHISNNLDLLSKKFFSYKSCPKNSVNRKNISVSGNGKTISKIKNSVNFNKTQHSRNNSQLKKNKSKCET